MACREVGYVVIESTCGDGGIVTKLVILAAKHNVGLNRAV